MCVYVCGWVSVCVSLNSVTLNISACVSAIALTNGRKHKHNVQSYISYICPLAHASFSDHRLSIYHHLDKTTKTVFAAISIGFYHLDPMRHSCWSRPIVTSHSPHTPNFPLLSSRRFPLSLHLYLKLRGTSYLPSAATQLLWNHSFRSSRSMKGLETMFQYLWINCGGSLLMCM